MPIAKLTLRPGVNRQLTATLNEGGWTDANLVRFRDGVPQPIGGWVRQAQNNFLGVCRGLHAWAQLDGTRDIALGTSLKLYLLTGGAYVDLTPLRASFATTNAFSTAAGSATVTLALPGHGAGAGDSLILPAVSVGGLALGGEYVVASAPDANTLTFAAAGPASATVGGGGGSVTVSALLSIGSVDTQIGAGWGAAPWGTGTWGTARGSSVTGGLARLWTLDNWGEELVACPRGGAIYNWKPSGGVTSRAAPIAGAPRFNAGVFVAMPERHLIAFGAETGGVQDPLLVRWSDVEDYTSWGATATNSAGSFRLGSGTQIVGWLAGPQEILVWTDTGVWAMRFVGLPYVYSFLLQGDDCGLIAPRAAVTANSLVFWMARREFMSYSGGVRPLPCDVWDAVFGDLNTDQTHKIHAGSNAGFGEVWWHYPSAGSSECDSYVLYNYLSGTWSLGKLARTAWIDAGTYPNPLATDPSGLLFAHEQGTDDDGQAMNPYAVTGYVDVADGGDFVFVDQVIPDFGAQAGTVLLTLTALREPNAIPTVKGPFPVTPTTRFLGPRLRGRQVSLRVESNAVGAFWRLGAVRVRVTPDGRR